MKFSACGGWFRGDHRHMIEETARYGFHAMESLGWRGLDWGEVRRLLDEKNVTSTALLISSDNEEYANKLGNHHGMVWEDSREAFLEGFKETVAAAEAMRVPNIVVTSGNERSDVSREKQHEICVETMIRLGELAKGHDVTIVMEPLNILVNHMGYYLVTSAEGFQMMREVNNPKVKLLFDIYHQQISEGNLIRNITENIDLIGHFHMGDNPGRLEPGTGEINYPNIFAAIRKTNYDGYLAFECGRSVEVDVLCERMHALIDPFAD